MLVIVLAGALTVPLPFAIRSPKKTQPPTARSANRNRSARRSLSPNPASPREPHTLQSANCEGGEGTGAFVELLEILAEDCEDALPFRVVAPAAPGSDDPLRLVPDPTSRLASEVAPGAQLLLLAVNGAPVSGFSPAEVANVLAASPLRVRRLLPPPRSTMPPIARFSTVPHLCCAGQPPGSSGTTRLV